MAHTPNDPTPVSPAKPADCMDLQQQLDDALADSFPASDPVSFVTSQAEEYWPRDPANPASCADQGERDASGVKKPAS